MGTRDARIDAYIAKGQPFAQAILTHIRDVVHAAHPEVDETMKWNMPFFTYKGALLCNMAAFKAHASMGFWLGDQVVGDAAVDGGMGQFGRLTSVTDLPSRTVLVRYVKRAITLAEAGVKGGSKPKGAVADPSSQSPVGVPPELATALARAPEARAAFDAFSPSHRREYAEWIAEAKKPETKARRVQQTLEMLAEGKSRNWKHGR